MSNITLSDNITLSYIPLALRQQPDGSEALAIISKSQVPIGVVLADGKRVSVESQSRRPNRSTSSKGTKATTHTIDAETLTRLWPAVVVEARFLNSNENLRLVLVGLKDDRREAVEITMEAQWAFWEVGFGPLNPETVTRDLPGTPLLCVFDRGSHIVMLLPAMPGDEWAKVVLSLLPP